MCGAVTWRYTGVTTRNLVCYCADCQRATSSPMTAFLGMKTGQLQWHGKIEHYESSPGTFRGFCPACGTRLYFKSDRWPAETHVHAATLTNPGDYRPDAQVFASSRAGWLHGLPSLPSFDTFQVKPAAD